MKLDLDEMTIGEMVMFEEETGKGFGDMASMTAKDLQVLAWILLKRENPEATMEDAGAVKLSALDFDEEEEEDPGPLDK